MKVYRSRDAVEAFYLPLYWEDEHWDLLEAVGVLTNRLTGEAQTTYGEPVTGGYYVVRIDPRLKLQFMQREDFERQYEPVQFLVAR